MITAANCQKLRSTAPSGNFRQVGFGILEYALRFLPHPSGARCVRFYYTIFAADGVGELLTYDQLLGIGDHLRDFRRWKKKEGFGRYRDWESNPTAVFSPSRVSLFNAAATAPRLLLCRWVSRSILFLPFGG